MLIVGLTGGLACGKTTAANEFAKLGIQVIDTDMVAREVVEDQLILQKIVNKFGEQILTKDGKLDRRVLRSIIFQDKFAKTWLEDLLHPLIWEKTKLKIKSEGPYVILVVPLLIESKLYKEVDMVVVIDCDLNLQIKRAISRDPISTESEINAIISSQIDPAIRLQYADLVIKNNFDLLELCNQVKSCHNKLLRLAR